MQTRLIRGAVFLIALTSTLLFAQELSDGFKKHAKIAFRAVTRIELLAYLDDGYAQRRLDAEKAVDDADNNAQTDADKRRRR